MFGSVLGTIFLILVVLFVIILLKSVYLIRQAESIIVERLGRFDRVLTPGIHFIMPFLEKTRTVTWSLIQEVDGKKYYRFLRTIERIDLREGVYDFPRQNVITKDNVTMEINALLYYQITDPKAAVYEVNDLPQAIEKLTQTTLRNVIGSMALDETLSSRDHINERLRIILDEATDKWGVKINRVELQEINPPLDIRQAMEKQMRAERDRRAIILEAEGKKSSAILEAEGVQESQVLRARGQAEAKVIEAQGEADARLRVADAEAKAVEMLRKVTPDGDPFPYLVALQYIKVFPEMVKGKNDKLIMMPYEASSLVGSLGSLKKIFDHVGENKASDKK